MQQRQHLITLTLQCTVFFSQFVGLFKSKCLRANKQESAKESHTFYWYYGYYHCECWIYYYQMCGFIVHHMSVIILNLIQRTNHFSLHLATWSIEKTERRKAFTTLCKRWERYIIFGTRFKSLPLNKYDHFVFVCSLRFCATKTVCLCSVWQFFSFSHYQIQQIITNAISLMYSFNFSNVFI